MSNVGMMVGSPSRQEMYASLRVHGPTRSRSQVGRRLRFRGGLHGPVELLPQACGNFHGEWQTAFGFRPSLRQGRAVHRWMLKEFSMDAVREVRYPTAKVRLVRSVMHRVPCIRLPSPC